MDAPVPAPTDPTSSAGSLFDHVLVGIDETPESLVGAAQAGALRSPNGRLVLVGVNERYLAAHAGFGASDAEERLIAGTSDDLAHAAELVDADETVVTSGRLVDVLCAGCERRGATLAVVGVRPHGRLAALTFGGHDVDALHDARCSVLIARPGWGPSKPDKIVVGVDGSPESQAAEDVARTLGARIGCDVLPVIGLADGVSAGVLRAERDEALLDPGRLVDAVVGASSKASLIVVQSASTPGRRWGGEFVDRVAYRARCSVLVVRPASEPRP